MGVIPAKSIVAIGLMAAGAFVVPAFGDSISPSSYSATIAVGETASLTKTVSITEQRTAPLDIMFLTDTTGSMGSSINAIRTGFASVVTGVGAVATDVHFGAAEYKDIFDVFTYRENIDLTGSQAAVQAAIAAWSASGGGDTPEGNVIALREAANLTSWRPGSQRFLVWTGDAPGHDPRNGVTLAQAISALVAADVTVLALNAPTGPGINQTGQAVQVAAATGGEFLGTFSAADITDAILDAITGSILNYSLVDLGVVGLGPGLDVDFTPASYAGAFDRTITRDFIFDVDFTGLAPGTYDFEIVARVDGSIVATETDRITVGDGGEVPEPSTYLLMGAGLAGLAWKRRRALQN